MRSYLVVTIESNANPYERAWTRLLGREVVVVVIIVALLLRTRNGESEGDNYTSYCNPSVEDHSMELLVLLLLPALVKIENFPRGWPLRRTRVRLSVEMRSNIRRSWRRVINEFGTPMCELCVCDYLCEWQIFTCVTEGRRWLPWESISSSRGSCKDCLGFPIVGMVGRVTVSGIFKFVGLSILWSRTILPFIFKKSYHKNKKKTCIYDFLICFANFPVFSDKK